ncbi:MAG TPA: hypothetical protein VKZ81_00805 [Pseudonocardia sp.]|jgi:hypothetical protein|uniref:hypothetical protein n=1 Tax=Pseudonocardia sp. TaxID=60912 RepID=UPI002B4B572D|nr:hypothetical protein [Pseudonocardia sp.]HLU53973.1 hypothetical protein [Pseudonocardia sp.]
MTAGGPQGFGLAGLLRPHTLAWGALWFAVVVLFTAGVGVIQAAGAAGEMPPLTSDVEQVIRPVDPPSSAPEPPRFVDVARPG